MRHLKQYIMQIVGCDLVFRLDMGKRSIWYGRMGGHHSIIVVGWLDLYLDDLIIVVLYTHGIPK